MKYLFFLVGIFFLVSCSNNPTPKPDNLLDEEVMVDIIFDISILQSADGAYTYKLAEANIEIDQYLFDKYKIDSTTYSQNQRYYASDPKKYKKIYKKVIEKLEQEQIKNEELLKNADKVNVQKDPIPTN
ncbi:MAG: DUF4296 domain-containing protein [Flavobacterium sp.]